MATILQDPARRLLELPPPPVGSPPVPADGASLPSPSANAAPERLDRYRLAAYALESRRSRPSFIGSYRSLAELLASITPEPAEA